MKRDFEKHMREAMEAEMRSFTTIRARLTVGEGEDGWLCIDGTDRPWFFDKRGRTFYWVDHGVTPTTWIPYRHEAGTWQALANVYEIVGGAPYGKTIAESWREITDPPVLALLAAIELAVESHLAESVTHRN
jgi:hypothetical protein